MTSTRYVFLDPDGALTATGRFGMHVLVEHNTGVVYGHQCGGHSCEQRRAEGYLIPVDGAEALDTLSAFFPERGVHTVDATWSPEDLAVLTELVQKVFCWRTMEGTDTAHERHALQLDQARTPQIAEGWIPVITPFGKGILLFENSD